MGLPSPAKAALRKSDTWPGGAVGRGAVENGLGGPAGAGSPGACASAAEETSAATPKMK